MSDEPSLHDDAILKGRLALALVSERAAECRNKACARKRQCLARMGKGFNCFKPMGDCPNMTETEWRMVGFGMACMRLRLSAWLRAEDDEAFAREAALPPHERRRAQAARAKEGGGGAAARKTRLPLRDVPLARHADQEARHRRDRQRVVRGRGAMRLPLRGGTADGCRVYPREVRLLGGGEGEDRGGAGGRRRRQWPDSERRRREHFSLLAGEDSAWRPICGMVLHERVGAVLVPEYRSDESR